MQISLPNSGVDNTMLAKPMTNALQKSHDQVMNGTLVSSLVDAIRCNSMVDTRIALLYLQRLAPLPFPSLAQVTST